MTGTGPATGVAASQSEHTWIVRALIWGVGIVLGCGQVLQTVFMYFLDGKPVPMDTVLGKGELYWTAVSICAVASLDLYVSARDRRDVWHTIVFVANGVVVVLALMASTVLAYKSTLPTPATAEDLALVSKFSTMAFASALAAGIASLTTIGRRRP